MLTVKDLHASAGGREILRGIDLSIDAGEVHAIMGPNGSGKSTLARALAGNPEVQVTRGQVLFDGQDLLTMDPESRARAGMFMAFQYPVEIPGVNNAYFLKAALNAVRAALDLARDEPPDETAADQPDLSLLDEAADPDPTERTARLFFDRAPIGALPPRLEYERRFGR